MTSAKTKDNGIYYYLGTITSHVTHALPLYRELGGTFVVTSQAAEHSLARYNIPVLRIDTINEDLQKQVDRLRAKLGLPVHSLQLGRPQRATFQFLETNAKVVIFYELYEFTKHTALHRPKTVFIPHGNILKSYFDMYPQRKETIKAYDYMAGMGPDVKKGFIKFDGIDAKKLADIGVARTDELYQFKKKGPMLRRQLTKRLGIGADKKIVAYLPTFWGASSIYHTGKEILRNVDDSYVVLVRLHPQVPADIRKEYDDIIASKPNLIWADDAHHPELDISTILCISDIILGDVSSVVLEAILVDKPLVFVYDIGEYRQSPDDYKLIPDIVSWSEYIDMDNVSKTNDILKTASKKGVNERIWKATKNRVFYNPNGDSVAAISQFIRSIM